MRALVVFHDHGIHWAAPLLKRGFRHVFVAVLAGDYWVMIDPRAGVPNIEVIAGPEFDLAAFYREHGMTAVETETTDSAPWLPFAYANCVGVVKAVLGLRAPFVVTPHQLYRRLKHVHPARQGADQSAQTAQDTDSRAAARTAAGTHRAGA